MIVKMSTARYFRLLRSEEGATAVEAAIVLSTFLVITLGLVQFATAYWNYTTMLLAVDEGGRYAMVNNQGPPAPCGAQTQAPGCPLLTGGALENCAVARAQTVLANYQAPNTIAVSANRIAGSGPPLGPPVSPDKLTICSSYSFSFIAPTLLPFGPIALQRQVTVPLD
jgi:TadE-like protein